MTEHVAYPCPCGGKVKWKKERVVQEGIDCGILDVEYCEKCKEQYLPEESMLVVEQKLKDAGLWGVQRREVKFWKSGKSVVIRLPAKLVEQMGIANAKKGYLHQEGTHKISIEF